MEPVLSIIIPVYNVEKYLPGCLESALAQDIPGLEIICVNDGSTDSSPEILQAFATRDERIAVIDKPNAGYGAAMNNGLRAARGRYVGILESDDKVCDGAWQTLLDVAIANELDMVRGSPTSAVAAAPNRLTIPIRALLPSARPHRRRSHSTRCSTQRTTRFATG